MASSSTSQEIVPSPSTSATRSRGFRSMFSSRCNCFNCCSVQSNSIPSTSTTSTQPTHASQGITPSPSDTHAFEQAAPASTSTLSCNTKREPENEHTNAFEGIAPSPSTSGRSTMPERKLPYDVFINHRGPDVKHTLAASLYNTLTVMGLRVFLDKEELELGDFLPTEIEEAMRSASLHIAIFSQNYAESPWCLAELSFMIKTGTKIVPVFYHVETDVVRYAKGVYAEAFSRHEEKGRYTLKMLQEWKNALKNVSYNFGDIVRDEDDVGRLLKNIVNHVLKEIKNVPFEFAKHPIGLDEAFQDFERTRIQSAGSQHNVQIVGIWGMGGSGKTTLAKQIYNNKHITMDKSSFLLDVRDAASRSKLHKKQKKLIEDLGIQGVSIENVEEGKRILSNRLQSIRVLIILDDVDNVDQLDALVPRKDGLGWGSLIVVTSREFEVFRSSGISSIYKMKALDPPHAKQLFCWHAFFEPSPHQGFEDLVEKFLNVCDGLPLSLKVFGAQLYGITNKDYWKTQLQKILRILPKDIKERMKISYDALDDEERQIFLDIACFFIGTEITSAIAAWDGLGWNGLHSWEQLLNKCLVESDYDFIRMHDHLRDLGREIANQRSPYRLWSSQQIINVDNGIQGISIRAITTSVTGSTSDTEEFHQCSQGRKLVVNTNRGSYSLEPSLLGLKFLHIEGNGYNQVIGYLSRQLVLLRWNDIEQRNLRSLRSLQNLRVLELYGNWNREKRFLKELWKTDDHAPVQLRELVIFNCSEFQGFPKSIGCLKHLKKIAVINGSKMTNLPKEFCLLQSLEHLELWDQELSSLPSGFGDLKNLRHLELRNCGKLKRLPISFKELTLLQHISLGGCDNLNLELDILENMTKLEYLDIESCNRLSEELPRHITNQASLTELSCRLREVPVNIDQLTKLQRMNISGTMLTSLPTSVGDLSSLTSLRIWNSPKLECLPDSLGRLNLLQHLDIACKGVKSLPKSARQLINLQTLKISSCSLREFDLGAGLFTCLKEIQLIGTEVSKISISCPSLEILTLWDNRHLIGIEVPPNKLQRISLARSPELDVLPSFAQSAFLREFKLEGCYRVKKIQGLEHCRELEELTTETRWEEAGIESLERMHRLRIVRLKAVSRSGVEGCIQSMQKWPREDIIVCAQAVPDASALVKSFALPNLSVVDSFTKRKIMSDPSLKCPSAARCILVCFVLNCESPKTSLHLACSKENEEHKTYLWNYPGIVLEKGKWVWIALFTQHSEFHKEISRHTQSRVHIIGGYHAFGYLPFEGEVEKGLIVTGEEERVWEVFTHLWASVSN
ncbi:disease resistance protein RUN1 isoform X1 [Cryptomeria japonica]|uniref:disease resistance protein RUN1 isoform X1 n=1 Tax=Cryptomeria japonica TaxID=3369 RepID=UPI0025AC0294|nr:disease resistance protein RUN1 isoform X1 [Cryptomeria japonica]